MRRAPIGILSEPVMVLLRWPVYEHTFHAKVSSKHLGREGGGGSALAAAVRAMKTYGFSRTVSRLSERRFRTPRQVDI